MRACMNRAVAHAADVVKEGPRSGSFRPIAVLGSSMLILNSSDFIPLELSTRRLLVRIPLLPRRSMIASMGPLSPGANRHGSRGNFAAVHPQEGLTL